MLIKFHQFTTHNPYSMYVSSMYLLNQFCRIGISYKPKSAKNPKKCTQEYSTLEGMKALKYGDSIY